MNKSFSNTLRDFFHDQGLVIFLILVPLVYPLLYGWIYHQEMVHEVPIVVVDGQPTSRSRDFLRRMDATAEVRIVAHAQSVEEAERFVRHREAYGIVHLPEDFTRGLARGEQVHVGAFVDMSGMLYYKAIVTAATEVSLAMNAEIKVERAATTTQREAEVVQHPLHYEQVAIFNPQSGFASFLLPAFLVILIQQTLVLGIGMEAGTRRERMERTHHFPLTEEFTFDDEDELRSRQADTLAKRIVRQMTGEGKANRKPHPLQPQPEHVSRRAWRQLLGRSAAFFAIYMPVACYCLFIVPQLFELSHMGNRFDILLFATPLLLAIIFLGVSIGHFARTRESIILIVVFSSVPMLFLSGVSWPGTAFPWVWKTLSCFMPSTFGVNGFVRLNSMGATLADVQAEYVALWLQAICYCLVAWWVTRKNELRKITLKG